MKGCIAVFDSGVGGLSVLKPLTQLLPFEDFVYFADNLHVPYGDKPVEEVKNYVFKSIEKILACQPKAVVIACNTATSLFIDELRKTYPDALFFGVQPAVKPAAKFGNCLTLVTNATSKNKNFLALCDKYANGHAFVYPLPDAARLIENNVSDEELEKYIKDALEGVILNNFSTAVLGCTHYSLRKKVFEKALGNLPVMDGNVSLAKYVKKRLTELKLTNNAKLKGSVSFVLSNPETKEFLKYISLFNF